MTPVIAGSLAQEAVGAREAANRMYRDDRAQLPTLSRRRWVMAKRAGATMVETKGSHAIYVSQPGPEAALIERAAKGGA